jgi:hypothetical protein
MNEVPFRKVLLVLVGVAGLLAKHWLAGTIGELGHRYLGNITASFSVYFIIAIGAGSVYLGLSRGARWKVNKLWPGLIALAVVEGFELTNGYGIMSNVYDPLDLLANAVGIALALGLDLLLDRLPWRRVSAD